MDNFLLTLIQLTLPQEAKVITSIKVSSILDVSGTLKISHTTKCDYFNVLLCAGYIWKGKALYALDEIWDTIFPSKKVDSEVNEEKNAT